MGPNPCSSHDRSSCRARRQLHHPRTVRAEAPVTSARLHRTLARSARGPSFGGIPVTHDTSHEPAAYRRFLERLPPLCVQSRKEKTLHALSDS